MLILGMTLVQFAAAGSYASGALVEAYLLYDHSEGTSTAFGLGTVQSRGSIAGSVRFLGGVSETRGFIYSGGASGLLSNYGSMALQASISSVPELSTLMSVLLGVLAATNIRRES